METSAKRAREAENEAGEDGEDDKGINSLSRPISPPAKKQRQAKTVPSPWQLTWIRDLPESLNRDAVTLKDLLGDPLISECWEFNYLHDVNFLMNAFDNDTRHLVKVHIVHGFWKKDDPNRQQLQEEAAEFDNVELHAAFMPEMFGTHHSKMMILFRHDDTAQVIIHTANMIAKDWTNMTNAVWRTPLLPLLPESSASQAATSMPDQHHVGSGEKFKVDLLSYLRCYDRRRPTCHQIANHLKRYDFSAVKAALIASVPGRHDANDPSESLWGWPGLKRTLRAVPCSDGDAEIVVQISSIATLGAKDDWLQKTLFNSLNCSSARTVSSRPKFKVVFPTADEIRRSLDGYSSGGSIHTKIQSAQQAKQLEYLRPIFHHWANDASDGEVLPDDSDSSAPKHDAGRARAAPHVKTYVRYNKEKTIDWALLTSANLSKQAWGEAVQSTGQVRIASWEIGVLVWPELIENDSLMVPTFQADMPDEQAGAGKDGKESTVVGVRIPYNMPLQRYGRHEIPWVASMTHAEPDQFGRVWGI